VKQGLGRKVAAACIVVGGICLLAAIFAVSLPEQSAASRDFIGYWAAGQRIVRGADPYDAAETLRLEKAVGLGKAQIKITPSPPIGLALVVPLGFLGAKSGLVVWLVAQMACLSASLWIVWFLQGKPASRIHLLGFLFAPALACLMAGQLGNFFLLGVSLFLWLQNRRPFLAGMALLPMSLKPHLFLPVALALVLWVIWKRRFGILAGFAVAMALSYAVVLKFDRHVWPQFTAMMHSNLMHGRFAPTLSAYLRLDVAPGAAWLEYVATGAASAWAVWYFWTRRDQWDWMDHGLLVLLVSLMCAPYAWLTDEAVLMPAVLVGVYRVSKAGRSWVPIAVMGAIALIELFANVGIISWYFTWTAPAWLAWYLYATRRGTSTVREARRPSAVHAE
jgi:hypothetical protein